MGLDDLTNEVKEEVGTLSDDEIKEHSDRVVLLSEIVVNLDGRAERLEDRVSDLQSRVNELEGKLNRICNQNSDEGFLDGAMEGQQNGNSDPWL